MVINDTKLDPYILVQKLFGMFFSGVQQIKFNDFDAFMQRFFSYFTEPDLELFLKEVKMLERKDPDNPGEFLVDINEIAAMIKNDIEMMPR